MNKENLFRLKDQLNTLCKEVGAYQLENLGREDLIVESKTSSVDLVTEIDKGSEEKIINFIKKHYPSHGILAEESGMSTTDSEYLWIIDPVDGTTNYAHGYPLFAISIGLQFKGHTILGVIYLPYLKDFFWAIDGCGAYLHDKPIHVSKKKSLESSIITTGFPYNKKTSKNNNLDYFGKIMPQVCGIRRSGSACVDLVNIACGRMEGYFEMYLNPWDFVPGQLIIHEAGGICTSKELDGRYSVLATNPYIREELISQLKLISCDHYPMS